MLRKAVPLAAILLALAPAAVSSAQGTGEPLGQEHVTASLLEDLEANRALVLRHLRGRGRGTLTVSANVPASDPPGRVGYAVTAGSRREVERNPVIGRADFRGGPGRVTGRLRLSAGARRVLRSGRTLHIGFFARFVHPTLDTETSISFRVRVRR